MARETELQRRKRLDRELEKRLNREMVPLMLPMAIAAGWMAGVIITHLFIQPFDKELIGIFMLTGALVGFAPLGYMALKYR